MTNQEQNFGTLMRQLQTIVDWYDQQQELDIEEGLAKARQAADLIRRCSRRLGQLENEFVKIKAELDAAASTVHHPEAPGEAR